MARIIYRTVEVCQNCGAWNAFRKGPDGKSTVNRRTGLRRIYGECRVCHTKIIVQYIAQPKKDPNIALSSPNGGMISATDA